MLLPNELPAPHRLLTQPELAALAVLDVALEVAQGAIMAAYPGWGCPKGTTHPHADRCAHAGMIRRMAYELQQEVYEYLRAQVSDLGG